MSLPVGNSPGTPCIRQAESGAGVFPVWPAYDSQQMAAVSDVLRSGRVNYWTGDECREFEREFASYVNTRHAVAVANGTVALELALHALDLPAGSEVIVPSRTFLATASAVVRQGCRPVFADIDANSGNLSAATIAPLITSQTCAIICVHMAGWPCEMDEINALARRCSLKVIEDCASPRRGLSRATRWISGRRCRVFVLPGQDHHHRR